MYEITDNSTGRIVAEAENPLDGRYAMRFLLETGEHVGVLQLSGPVCYVEGRMWTGPEWGQLTPTGFALVSFR